MRRREYYQEEKLKKMINIFFITLLLSLVIFLTIFVMYNKKQKEAAKNNFESSLSMMEEIVSNNDFEETSFSKDLSLNDVSSTIVDNTKNEVKEEPKKVTKEPVSAIVENVVEKETKTTEEVKEELDFDAPSSGEIVKDFAQESLVFSNTLDEWTTHSGIDIKADKMSIVTAAEEGTIESIKNDPRYGLTITIAHRDGFKTIYSNLLTTEFVTENEIVEKGQTIATVGESASFEVADEPHLHFEIYKDGIPVNPTIYLK